ncbi:MAG TPA: hypothetical protein VNQ90_15790 [Chthoniobacteraceae bacterium]|nr:hypothetical protein [Chthoniobacteraceae bacterium]
MLLAILLTAVLMALLIAAVGQVRRKAASQRCLSNLRQIGVAMIDYTQDHRVFPYYISNTTRWMDGSADPASFFAGPYLNEPDRRSTSAAPGVSAGKGGVFDCPAITAQEKEGRGPAPWPTDSFDYAMNLTLCGRPPVWVRTPSRTVVVTEGGHSGRIKARWTHGLTYTPFQSFNPGGTAWDYQPTLPLIAVHAGKAHFFFADGHIGLHAQSETDEGWYDGR